MKATMKQALAMLLTLVLVIGLLPTGLLSFTAAAEETSVPEVEEPTTEPSTPEEEVVETRIIYVNGETGEDIVLEEGAEFPNGHVFKTIQAAVNAVPAKNTIPTTIEIADGAYNVFLTAEDANAVHTKGNTLMIGKSNLTLKAQNDRKVIIYGYSDASTNTYDHHNNSVLRIRNSENLTLEGLVILPHFSNGTLKGTTDVAPYNQLAQDILGKDILVGDANGQLRIHTAQAMIRTDNYAAVHSNGGVKTANLTFKNCYLGGTAASTAITLVGSEVTGDYHLIGNTIIGALIVEGAGNAAEVESEIVDNTFLQKSPIKLTGTLEKHPVIEDNIFKNTDTESIGSTTTVISVAATTN